MFIAAIIAVFILLTFGLCAVLMNIGHNKVDPKADFIAAMILSACITILLVHYDRI